MPTLRFDGAIAGIGTAAGTRLVLGLWPDSPFGPIVDAMVERSDGHRVLIAPTEAVAAFIAATYEFDEVRVEPTALTIRAGRGAGRTPALSAELVVGRRTAVGVLLSTVPRRLARARWWCQAIDPVARAVRPGVHTIGTAGGGRREWYCALDEHVITAATVRWDGVEVGPLRPVVPPVRFGFASTPPRPALVRVTTLVQE
jgi:hypothetical protein